MRDKSFILIIGFFFTMTFSILLIDLKFDFEKSIHFVFYVFGVVVSFLLVLIISFFVFIYFYFLKKQKSKDKRVYFLIGNFICISLLLILCAKTKYENWYFTNYQSYTNHNVSLTSEHNNYLDTCFRLIQLELETKGHLKSDYKIVSYEYDENLKNSEKTYYDNYYDFFVIYNLIRQENNIYRASKYHINKFSSIKTIYDVEINDLKAQEQIKGTGKILKDLKEVLDSVDTSDEYLKDLKRKLN